MDTQEVMKKCKQCGEVKPLSMFNRQAKAKDGYMAHCKSCHAKYAIRAKENNAPKVVDAPKVEQSIVKECDDMGLSKVPARLLVHELRRRGYRGKLELVTIQELVI